MRRKELKVKKNNQIMNRKHKVFKRQIISLRNVKEGGVGEERKGMEARIMNKISRFRVTRIILKKEKRQIKEILRLYIKTNPPLKVLLKIYKKLVGHRQIYLDHLLKKYLTMMKKNKNLYFHLVEAVLQLANALIPNSVSCLIIQRTNLIMKRQSENLKIPTVR
jgi:RNA recognition motif-containing protein